MDEDWIIQAGKSTAVSRDRRTGGEEEESGSRRDQNFREGLDRWRLGRIGSEVELEGFRVGFERAGALAKARVGRVLEKGDIDEGGGEMLPEAGGCSSLISTFLHLVSFQRPVD